MNYASNGLVAGKASSYSQTGGTYADMGNSYQPALGQIQMQPSLEDHLQTLISGIERLYGVKRRIERISEKLRIVPENGCATPASPPASDLSGKYAEAVRGVHSQCDEIELFVNRIENALFQPETAQCEKPR